MPNQSMQELGSRLHASKVREIFFVHGTYVGDDPLGIFSSPSFFSNLEESFKHKTKEFINSALGDVGNYTPEYVDEFGKLLDHGICEGNAPFEWGGGNLHKARLEGTIELAAKIAESITNKKIQDDERILLIGHSHAGQLFALLTIFLQDKEVANQLLTYVQDHLGNQDQFKTNIATIRKVWLDFVTFGTPVRYRWARYEKFRLLPVINHRSDTEFSLTAIYNVKNGDYVQQWGTEGTDSPLLNQRDDEKILSKILQDAGFNLTEARENIESGTPQHPASRQKVLYQNGDLVSENVLIDYGDKRSFFNFDPFYCVKKVFGHGVYTTEAKMLFNTQLIADKFYPKQ